jgi:transglutaminase-like putative cysteine protease
MTNNNSLYLEPGPAVDSQSEAIIAAADRLTETATTTVSKAAGLFHFVRDSISYNPFTRKVDISCYMASHTLANNQGYCVQKAVLLAALCRASGIPARLHYADIRSYVNKQKLYEHLGTNLLMYHGYNELYIDGEWLAADATFDIETCRKQGMRPIDFNGQGNARLHTRSTGNELQFEFITDRGSHADVPFAALMDSCRACWGDDVTRNFAEGDPTSQRFSD